jgi:ATP-dependent RNA helicase DDX6/DHH1
MGYDHPSPVQEEAIPYIIDGKNVIAKAKNGTGKTGSYAIPIVEKIDLNNDKI